MVNIPTPRPNMKPFWGLTRDAVELMAYALWRSRKKKRDANTLVTAEKGTMVTAERVSTPVVTAERVSTPVVTAERVSTPVVTAEKDNNNMVSTPVAGCEASRRKAP